MHDFTLAYTPETPMRTASKRFPSDLSAEIFEHILNKALNHRMVDPSVIFIDGTHIKASANKKKFRKSRWRRPRKSMTSSFVMR